MPLHDWTDERGWDSVHPLWLTYLVEWVQPRLPEGYRAFLGESCCESFELRYRLNDKLVGVAIVDRGERSLSAVYCYFDPAQARLGLGTYSILKQIALCRSWGLRHLYLGLYIGECSAMAYKSRFLPHERLSPGSDTVGRRL